MAGSKDEHEKLVARARGDNFVPGSEFQGIKMLGYPRRLADLKRGDMLVGYLFEHAVEQFAEGQLAGAMPISGPIFWVELVGEYLKFTAQCAGCGEGSKAYTERDGKILRWAYDHRCKQRRELSLVIR